MWRNMHDLGDTQAIAACGHLLKSLYGLEHISQLFVGGGLFSSFVSLSLFLYIYLFIYIFFFCFLHWHFKPFNISASGSTLSGKHYTPSVFQEKGQSRVQRQLVRAELCRQMRGTCSSPDHLQLLPGNICILSSSQVPGRHSNFSNTSSLDVSSILASLICPLPSVTALSSHVHLVRQALRGVKSLGE